MTSEIIVQGVAETEEFRHVREMFAKDACSAMMGMKLTGITAETAVGEMLIRPDMCNGFGSAQGGMLFTFADSIFAAMANAAGKTAVAAFCSIHYARPAFQGEIVTATAKLQEAYGKNGIVDVTVKNPAGKTVAEFRGTFRQIDSR
ncbi:hydroxyphenylacetyl-CoA thioesterase PaaI [Corynebacterium propinquum]|uniref:hydroxyphenylacetyl-CoA thioesterase PaaI n=1 Tax=Corynebacterium propinquum TaxID=43769 RepID=UPI00253FF2D6|nr:hydroxyphenylacetyl-CoA thioesterase PaaI [Corynebacterium propinquum]MDK4258202.1 hydroxyphenylacetyl-CoA thioesterase PaaI [Corynebacterium propinquum]MDK4282211.1 hydroxyphenylacetyl-CoA thioesterase PaaI [Corynebacterium propinquum]MDK4298777.1 hydroxyphenylacetyl-CoA thioesterase PaaI [Corynebacterium propinquum]MDK8666114.1 hydroxyphenylacetyl-CoA thioesterase PaaI [Corynebacterium propinquum]